MRFGLGVETGQHETEKMTFSDGLLMWPGTTAQLLKKPDSHPQVQ